MLPQDHLNNFPTLLFVLMFHNSHKYQSSGEQNNNQNVQKIRERKFIQYRAKQMGGDDYLKPYSAGNYDILDCNLILLWLTAL